jgi:hypothetical protein
MTKFGNDIFYYMPGFAFFLGIVECFFGYRMLKVVLGVTGFIIGGLLCAEFVYDRMGGHPVISLLAGFVGGAIGSSLMIGLFVFGLFILGAALGLLIGGAISASIYGSTHPIIMAPLAIAGGIAAIVLSRSMIIISTSFIGAYLIVFSTGRFIGMPNALFGFPQYHGLQESSGQFLIMVLLWILVAIVGIFVQHKYTSTSARHEG